MKIIDLLNLMVISEEDLPKRIRYEDEIYYLSDNNETYIGTISHSAIGRRHCLEQCLTDEIEVLEEEKKIPEKLGYFDLTIDKNEKDENGDDLELHYTGVADTFDDVYEKINEIIDYLDYLKSKGE